MSYRKNKGAGNGNRNFGLSGAGKGDGDRSPGWREKYHEVDWPHSDEGFVKRGCKLVKVYGTPAIIPDDRAPNIRIESKS